MVPGVEVRPRLASRGVRIRKVPGSPVAVLDPRTGASRQERVAAETRAAQADVVVPPPGTWSFRGRP